MSRTDLDAATLARSLRHMAGDGGMEWCYEPIQASVLLDVADLLDENAKLRDEFRKMDEWHSKELVAAIDENAKLRELCRDMWDFYCVMPDNPHVFKEELDFSTEVWKRMRELRIEIDE